MPFRGPLIFASHKFPHFEYSNLPIFPSDVANGCGIEEITYNGELAYYGVWSGGLVLGNLDDIKIV